MRQLALAATLVALWSAAQAQPATRRPALPLAGMVTNPDWIAKPSGEDVARFYPPIAQVMRLEGRSTIQCSVNETGSVQGCTVLSEQPAGVGFGQAAIQLSQLFRMKPKMVDGVAVGGAEVTIPINFAMAPDEEPTTQEFASAPRPDEKAIALGRRIAIAGGSDLVLDVFVEQQLKQLRATEYAASSGADASAQEPALQAIADAFKAARDRYIDQVGLILARQFTVDELAQLTAHFESPAQKLWLSKLNVISSMSTALFPLLAQDISADARTRFCQKVACATPHGAVAQGAKP